MTWRKLRKSREYRVCVSPAFAKGCPGITNKCFVVRLDKIFVRLKELGFTISDWDGNKEQYEDIGYLSALYGKVPVYMVIETYYNDRLQVFINAKHNSTSDRLLCIDYSTSQMVESLNLYNAL